MRRLGGVALLDRDRDSERGGGDLALGLEEDLGVFLGIAPLKSEGFGVRFSFFPDLDPDDD